MKRPLGFTLVEVVLASLTLVVAMVAIFGAYIGQVTLNEHARNLALAIQDANRVIEQLRQQNATCSGSPARPNAIAPGVASWDAWFIAGAGGVKSLQAPASVSGTNELIVVTCQDKTGASYCGPNQIGTEWQVAGANTSFDPIRVTVALCWRHRSRTIGECAWNAGTSTFTPQDGANGPNNSVGVIESPAMLTTLVTCRG